MVKTAPVKPSLRPHRILWLFALFGAMAGLAVPAAQASALYRCKDKNGITAYTSSTAGYSGCSLVGNFPSDKHAAPAAETPAPAAAPSAAAVEFRTAPGGAEPKAVPTGDAKPRVSRGAVYRFTRDGVTHYTNRPPAGAGAKVLFTYIETCFACSLSRGLDFNSVGLNLTAYASEISAAAARNGVEEALVRAVIHAESAFNPNAVSRAGAQGLMQLMPATATRFGVTEPFTPQQNIDGGVQYLAWLSQRFGGDLKRIAAGYNAGEGAVDRYDGVPPYQETIVYVERVGILLERYRKELATPAPAAGAAAPVVAGAASAAAAIGG